MFNDDWLWYQGVPYYVINVTWYDTHVLNCESNLLANVIAVITTVQGSSDAFACPYLEVLVVILALVILAVVAAASLIVCIACVRKGRRGAWSKTGSGKVTTHYMLTLSVQ